MSQAHTSAGPAPPGADPAHVVLRGIQKSYGGTQALQDIDLDLHAGTIHGLVGENGAGKSTLMKILCGVERPDTGSISIDGEDVVIRSPADALAHQISIISQELSTVGTMTVLDNVFLGSWSASGGLSRPGRDRERFHQLCHRVGFHLDPDRLVAELSIAQQQQVEVLRAVSRGSRVLVMDEPTAVLTESETEALLELMRQLAASGVTVVLVSHFLQEVLGVCDTVTVLRDGRHVLTESTVEHTPATLVAAMVGRKVDVLFPDLPVVPADAPVILEVAGLGREPVVHDIELSVRAGEIVALAGLVGSGRSELARLIFGADKPTAGVVRVDGKRLRPGNPMRAMSAGVAMVPESRKDQGLLLNATIRRNVGLANLDALSKLGFITERDEGKLAARAIEPLDVRGASIGGGVWALSGGNQQKVLFAKWLARKPRLLIIDEPTRGVDVAAKVSIHRLIADLAAAGMAVLVISSEIEEAIGLSHRVVVLRGGRISAELISAQTNPEAVLHAAFVDREDRA